MTRRLLLLLGTAYLARADSAQDAREVVQRMAQALGEGDAAQAVSVLDRSMPGYNDLRGAIESLLKRAEAQSTIDVLSNAGTDNNRSLKLRWHLHLDEREGARGTTERHAEVICRVELRDGHWLITAFEPLTLFALPRGAESWNVLQAAAGALSEGNAAGFLANIDPTMAGYETLRTLVTALAGNSEVESSVELVTNQGDDSKRTLEVDWTLEMVNPDTGIRLTERHERVKCQMQWRERRWRITGLDPLAFFRPAE